MIPCLKKVTSLQAAKASAPVPRTNPYDAPYFFPTPLSPEAVGYVSRARMERSPSYSPEYRLSPLPGTKSIVSHPVSPLANIEVVSEAHTASDGRMSSPEGSVDEEGVLSRASTGRVLSFSSQQSAKPRKGRPTSWGSEAPTLATSRSNMSLESSSPTSLPRHRPIRPWR